MNNNLKEFKVLDKILIESARKVRLLYHLEPLNLQEVKDEFLKGNVKNPSFRYRKINYNPQEIEDALSSIEVPDGVVGDLYNQKIDKVLSGNKAVQQRTKQTEVKNADEILNSYPEDDLVSYAEDILKDVTSAEEKKNVTADKVKDSMEKALYDVGLFDWRVEYSDKWITTVIPSEKKITVCKDRLFAKNDPERLTVHEVGVHAVRAANGYKQPLKIFALGLPGYLATEEGMAMYFEKKAGVQSAERLRDYAGRVIAVDSFLKGSDFRKTFKRLTSLDFGEEQAWDLSVRVFRGGGVIKDHVYLKGYRIVEEYMEKDGDLQTLYVGKTGVGDLDLVRKMLKRGLIKEPSFFPASFW